MRSRTPTMLLVAALASAFVAAYANDARAQGAGATGATILQMHAGARAAALSGAYTAASHDADVIFYNPAGIASLRGAFSLSYQRHVEDIGLATAAAAFRVGSVSVAVGAAFLDQGTIAVVEPDPSFGGQTGRPTDLSVSAYEVAGRFAVALALFDDRLRLGAAGGTVAASLAEENRSSPVFDAGAQYDIGPATLAGALTNLGSPIAGGALADADLPTEARLGISARLSTGRGIGAQLSADVVNRRNEGQTGFVAGLEAGLVPGGPDGFGALIRAGFDGMQGDGGLGRLRLGGGLVYGGFALDYAYQSFQHFGAIHRIGARWIRFR